MAQGKAVVDVQWGSRSVTVEMSSHVVEPHDAHDRSSGP